MSISRVPSGKWRARYRDPTGKERAQHFDRKVDAERWEAAQKADVARGVWFDTSKAKELFEDYAKRWQKHQLHHRRGTVAATTNRMKVHITPTFGKRAIGSIQRSEVQAWVSSLSLAPSTTEAVYRLFAQVMRSAVDDGVIARTPCVRINLPARSKRDVVVPTLDQVEAVAAKMPAHLAAIPLLAAGTGMRLGECTGLTVDRVDFLRGTITIDRQLQYGELVEPKTASSNRTIPVAQPTLDVLAAHLALRRHAELVFVNRVGKPIVRQHLNEAWRGACEAAEVQLRFHDLRHFCASALIAHGASVVQVQHHLGHASARETLDVYAHLWPDDESRVREALERVLAPANADGSRTGGV